MSTAAQTATPEWAAAQRLVLADGREFFVQRMVRELLGRRRVYAGAFMGELVYAKHFFDPRRARRDCERERDGLLALTAHGIPAPVLRHAGPLADGNGWLVITRAIVGALPAAALLAREHTAAERAVLLRRLVQALTQHHHAGLLQRDLHLNNFLLDATTVYTLDAADLKITRRISRRQSRAQLALLYAQLPPRDDALIGETAHDYGLPRAANRHLALPSLLAAVQRARTRRLRRYLRKTARTCTAFGRHAAAVYARERDSPALRALLERPEQAFGADAHFLKQGRSATLVQTRLDGMDIVIKRYNRGGLSVRLRRLCGRGRAAMAWRNAHRLRFYGLPTAAPIALIEPAAGPSYLLAAQVTGPTLRDWCVQADPAAASSIDTVQKVSAMLREFAGLRLIHGDLKATNFLLTDAGPVLVDLDALRPCAKYALCTRALARERARFLANFTAQPVWRELFRRTLEQPQT